MRRNSLIIFIRTYIYEIIAFLVNIVIAYINFLLRGESYYTTVFSISAFIFFFSIIVIVYLKTQEKDFYFFSLQKPGEEKNWIGRGKFKFVRNEKCFEITDAHVGYITPKNLLWDDYRFEFDFKLVNKCLGWIVRASNLSNYIMLQCGYDGINPHIRINGEWIPFSHKENEDMKLTFDHELSPDTWYRAVLITEKRSIRSIIYLGKKPIFDRHWTIPTNVGVSYLTSKTGKQEVKWFQNIDYDFGCIGFRNYGDERAFIKKIYLEKL